MNSGGAQRIVLGAWLAMIAVATIKRVTDPDPLKDHLPPPSVFLGISVLFTMLFGAAAVAPGLAAAVAVGVDVGALLTPYIKAAASGGSPASTAASSLAGFLDRVSGANAAPPSAVSGGDPGSPAGPK